MKDLKSMYREMREDPFPSGMEITFHDGAGKRRSLHYEKVTWEVGGERKGLRYGENPDQGAAFFRLVNGNLALAGAETIVPGKYLLSDMELIQSGKHPGKTNLTDVDAALNFMRYLGETPVCAVVKHNNPSGVAMAGTLAEAYSKAYLADRVAAFGGAVVVNRELDMETAKAIGESYSEVVAAPDFAPGVVDYFAGKKNLRVMRVPGIADLASWRGERVLEFKTLIDGGCVVQTSFVPTVVGKDDFLPATCAHEGKTLTVAREPDEREYRDMVFGWLVETGITSNSVIYVKDGVTVGIGTGEQDRVGVAEIARDKAYRKLEDRLAFIKHGTPFSLLETGPKKSAIVEEARSLRGGLVGSVMVSDAFFPFRDGIDVGLSEGVSAVVQPGGSLRDFESIQACNEAGAAMKFTGQRCFRH